MGHSRRRPITGITPVGVGVHHIIVEMNDRPTTISCVANGTVTFEVDTTIQNITYDDAAMAGWNVTQGDRYVDPGDAVWTEIISTGSVDALFSIDIPVFAFQIEITAGVAGSVSYTILQA